MIRIQENIPLAPLTVFKIGGSARYFCEATTPEEVREAVSYAQNQKVSFAVLGAGSNTLVADEGYSGLVIKMQMRTISVKENTVTAGAGASMAQVVVASVGAGLTGFEWAIGVPGTIGGSVVGNAGCFGGEMKDVIETVELLDTESGDVNVLKNAECHFAYRESRFKKEPNSIILSVTLLLTPGDKKESSARILEYTKKRTSSQDIGSQCAGCIFKNPSQMLPAGRLIDEAGLKGLSVGQAYVSDRHGNYIINRGGAKAADVEALIKDVKEKIKKHFDIDLHEEMRRIK